MDSDVLLSDHTDGVLTLTLNRPHRRNALDTASWHALHAALTAARDDPALRALVITGAGGRSAPAPTSPRRVRATRSTGCGSSTRSP